MEFDFKNPFLLRKIIIEHYNNPENKILLKNNNILNINKFSKFCSDNIYIEMDIKKNKIINPKFDGEGCIISLSSTDIISSIIKNKNIYLSKFIILNYINMLFNKKYNKYFLEKLIIFININKNLNRIECASLGANAFLELINLYNSNK